MKTKFYLILAVLLTTSLTFTGCKNTHSNEPENLNESDNLNEPTTKGMIAKMDIADAATIFIAPADYSGVKKSYARRATSESSYILYKITNDGIIKKVAFTDKNQKNVTEEYQPTSILSIENSPYIFVELLNETYLVNKTTGAVYKCPSLSIETKRYGNRYFANEADIFTDNEGNLYYLSKSRVHKINISDINNIFDEAITPESDGINKYVLSFDGELFYCYYRDGYLHRLRSVGGKLIPYTISSDGGNYDNIAFRGLDGKIHIFDRKALQIITFGDYGSISADTIKTNVLNTIYELEYGGDTTNDPYLIVYPNKIMAIGTASQALVLDSNDPMDITENVFNINNYMAISDLHYSASYIYCCGKIGSQYSIVRINPYTYARDVVLQDSNYEIYSFIVDNKETITFNGLRLSDGKTVIASIDKNGKFSTLFETTNSQKIELRRLQ